jgi:hypothetical protein
MGEVAEAVERLTVNVTSPDGRIRVHMGNRSLKVRFAPGSYHSYSEEALESQLTRLATAVWSDYQRGYLAVLKEHDLSVPDPRDPRVSEFLADRDRIESEGRSPNNCVKVRSVAMRHWQVRIRPGTLAALSEDEFAAEALHAVSQAKQGFDAQVAELRERPL